MFLRFVIFEKEDKLKNCARFFKICKYTFLIFEKGDKQKNCARFFKICKYAFILIFEKGISKKIELGFLRFVSILF